MPSQNPSIGLGTQLLRYVLTGGLNTVIGFAVLIGLLTVGVEDVLANACGFAVGILLSFFINRNWTFLQDARPSAREIASYLLVFGIAYSVNLFIILAGQSLGYGGSPVLHFLGVAAYSGIAFFLTRVFVYGNAIVHDENASTGSRGVIILCALIACLIIPGMPITHDVVWQFWIARQLNGGAEFYTQINEVNPPLWFWMAMPVDWLGRIAKVGPIALMQLAIIGLTMISCLISARLLPQLSKTERQFFLVNAFALGLIIAFGNFAQREQMAMIVALPYSLLIVLRVQSVRVSPALALMVGLLAAPGFALKHYFVAVPVILELWLLLVHRSAYRPVRPETAALAVVAVIYGVAIWQFAPAFLTLQLPMVFAAYDGYSQPFFSLINDREQFLWLMAIIGFWQLRKRTNVDFQPLTIGLLLVMGAFLFSYWVQDKGWVYHSMPVTYFMLLALITAAMRTYSVAKSFAPISMAVLALVGGYAFPVSFGVYNSRYAEATNEALASTPKGSSVYILSSDAQKSWPMVEENGYVWPSRFMSLWMVPAIAAKLGDQSELAILSDDIRRQTVEDLKCNPPVVILVDRATINRVLKPLKFDILAYFTEDAQAKEFMENYHLSRRTNQFSVFRRNANAARDIAESCRQIF